MLRKSHVRVLLVEDDPEDYWLTRRLLSAIEGERFGLEWARTYEEARASLKQDDYDICLLDYRLGEHDGLSLLRELDPDGARPPIIFLTGQRDRELDLQVIEAGADDYLVKGELTPFLLERSLRYALERRQRERALHASEARLRLINDQFPGGLWTTDRELRFTWISDARLRQHGLEAAALLGLSVAEVCTSTGVPDVEAAVEAHRRALAGETCIYETSFIGRLYRSRVQPFRDPAGAIVGTLGIALDVTDQRQAEASLLRETELQQTIAEHIPMMLARVDAEGRLTHANREWERVLGGSGVEAQPGSLLAAFYPGPEERDRAQRFTQQADGTWEDFRTCVPDGRVLDTTWACVRLSDGSIVGIGRDITRQKRDERQLRETTQALELAVEGISRLDAAGRYVSVNTAYARMLGYPPEELLGRDWTLTVPPEDQPHLWQFYRQLPEAGRVEVETRGVRKDGTIFQQGLVMVAAHDEQGEFAGHFCFMKDVTERRELEDQLRQAQKMDAIGNLAGGVAHDFNNMLAVINGFTELALASVPPGHRLQSYLTPVQQAGERAAVLTRQLLTFSRKQILEPKVLDLYDVLLDMEQLLRRLIGEDIELTCCAEPGLWLTKADRGQIEQVLMNLAVNARDAMPYGGSLTLRMRNGTVDEATARRHLKARPGEFVVLSVQDSGSGIPPGLLARIFEPFFTTKPPGKGTGLGLATVYGIVTQSGGWIDVESEPGCGTTFHLHLPRVEGEAAVAPERTANRLPTGSETILLVEDEPMVGDFVAQVLGSCGYTVLQAEEPEGALRIAESHPSPIHLLLTDVVMPRRSGSDVAREVLARRPRTRVLFMSGYTEDAVVHHGAGNAGMTLLEKPFSPLALALKVRAVLDAPRPCPLPDDPAGPA